MSSAFKIAKFCGGIIEVGFLISFVYEIGRETGRREASNQSNGDINVKEIADILKKVDAKALEKTLSSIEFGK